MNTVTRTLLAALLAAAPLHSQQPERPAESVTRVATGATLGGAAGFLAGALAGAYIGGNQCVDEANPDSCRWLPGMLIGSAVGMTVGVPLGAHIGNRRRGQLVQSMLASAVIGAIGTWALVRIEDDNVGASRTRALISTAAAIPVLQIVTSTWLERRSSR